MSSEVISKRNMASVLLAVGQAHIEVMRKIIRWSSECLAADNTQIALVLVSQAGQFGYNEWEIDVRSQKDIHVDDGLGGESGNSRAADMFDCCLRSIKHIRDP